MSVIYGQINSPAGTPIIDNLTAMTSRLRHWQPDHAGTWTDEHTGLGQLTLFNTPESEHERLPRRAGNLVIVADVRLDNRDELLHLLGLADARTTDSALILQLYQRYNTRCCEYLLGDFAFAIFNITTGQLFCARDHLGVKPLFYHHRNGCFSFASEIKGLLALQDTSHTANESYIFTLLTQMMPLPTETFYQDIQRLAPAHWLLFDRNGLKISRYWDLDIRPTVRLKNDEDYYHAFNELLEKAVVCRLRSSYPIGSQLSGGLDSSLITLTAQRLLQGNPLHTYSFVVSDEDKAAYGIGDEQTLIDVITQGYPHLVPHKICRSGWQSGLDELDRELFIEDGVNFLSSGWQEPIMRSASGHGVRTLLSGFPGDEAVSNSGSRQPLSYLDRRRYDLYAPWLFKPGYIQLLIRHHLHKIVMRFESTDVTLSRIKKQIDKEYAFLGKPSVKAGFGFLCTDLYLNRNRSYRHALKYRLLNNGIQRMEQETCYGIANRMEPRYPLADVRLIEFYTQMPDHLKYDSNLSRPFIRKATSGVVPDDIRLNADKSTPALAYSPVEGPVHLSEIYNWLSSFCVRRPELNFPFINIPAFEHGIPTYEKTLSALASQPIGIRKLAKLAKLMEAPASHNLINLFKT